MTGTMRIDGKLAKWNDDRGFGFITPDLGGQEIFVHISAFPKDGQRPRLGEALSFQIESDKDGRKRAKTVSRPILAAARPIRPRESTRSRKHRNSIGRAAPLLVAVILGVVAYGEYLRRTSVPALADDIEATESASSPTAHATSAAFQCDGRTHCSQMTSCAEANFFLRNCPNVQMDGNNDGVPCEQQWCGR